MEPLESSRRKVARAKEHIANLKVASRLFFDACPYTIVVEPDLREPKQEIHKLRLDGPLPDSFTNFTDDAVHNLRSALDNLGYALAVSSGRVDPKSTAFPFSGTALQLDNNIKGRCKDIPEEIYPLFRAYQPYKGGNDILWALNEVSITDKHKLLTVALRSNLGNMSGVGVLSMPLDPTWDRIKKEIEIATCVVGYTVKYHAEISLFVAFDEIAIVSGEPVLKVLDYFVDIVEDILSRVGAEARRLGIF